MKRLFLFMIVSWLLVSVGWAADVKMSDMTDGSASVAGTWYTIGYNSTSNYRFTLNSVLALGISDAAYGSGWDTITTIAPSKNAVYDKIQLIYAGGMSIASQAIGDLIYASSATQFGRIAGVAAGQPLLSGGVATVPAYAGWGFSGTAAAVYTLPGATKTLAAHDGSNFTLASQAAGDIIYAASASTLGRVAVAGQPGYTLTSGTTAGGTTPLWQAPGAAGTFYRGAGTTTTPTWSTSTFADTYVQGGLLHAATANTIAALAPGAVGSFLMSNGNAAALSYLAAGAANYVLVGAGTTTIPVWTAPTGTGAPVLANSPTFVDDITIGAAGVLLTGANGSLTILGLGDGQDEDIKIDLNTTANTITISSPASSASDISFSALNLATTGTINGAIKVEKDDDSLAAPQCYGTFHWYSGGAETITLPAAVVGMNLCVYSSDASVKNIDPNGTDTIVLNGTALTAGYQIESPGAVGNFICLMSFTANQWTTLGQSGVWITHGAD